MQAACLGLALAMTIGAATAVAVVMLLMSFVMLLVINSLQSWQRKRSGAA